jgi:hypothetical protein
VNTLVHIRYFEYSSAFWLTRVMEISNPRLTDRIYAGFTDRTRAGLKAGMPFADIKLRGSQHSGRKEDCSPRIKRAVRAGYSHYPLIRGLLLVLFVSSIRFVLRLLYPILLLCAPVPSHSFPLFGCNLPRSIFDPYARE